MNTQKIALVAAIGLGAYFLLSRTASAQPIGAVRNPNVQPGTVGYMPYPNTATLRAQTDQMNNSALYGIGNLIGGIFGTKGGTTGTAQTPRQQVAPAVNEIWNNDLPGQAGYGWKYYSDGTSIGPDGTYYSQGMPVWSPDGVAVNPPGGYDQPSVWQYDSYAQDF